MKREDVQELHYITPIDNVPSILEVGILSHVRAATVSHESIAMDEVQAIRKDKRIPGARRLHEYVNLYFDAHNPMLSRRRGLNDAICVLRVDTDVVDTPGAIVADRNAACSYVTFRPVVEGLANLDKERLFAQYWTHQNPYEQELHGHEKCAELLIPDVVLPKFIVGAFVANRAAFDRFQSLGLDLIVKGKRNFFF